MIRRRNIRRIRFLRVGQKGEKVLNVAEERWKRALEEAFSRRPVPGMPPGALTFRNRPFVIGPTLNGPGRAVLSLDGFDLHELYTCLVDRDGPEGCCAGCTILPPGWCLSCDRQRDLEVK